MDDSLKRIAVIASVIAAVGVLLIGIGFLTGGNRPVSLDWKGVHIGGGTNGTVTSSTLVSFSRNLSDFSSVNVDINYYDVDLVPSDKFAIDVTYYKELGEPIAKVENGTLIVEDAKPEPLSVNLGTTAKQPGVKIYYPENTKMKDVVIKSGASDLSFKGLTAEKAEFDLQFGKLSLADISAGNITVEMSSGDCTMENLTADGALNIKNRLGKTTLNGARADTLTVDANSGDVNLTDAVFDSGEINLDMGKLTAGKIESNGLKVRADKGSVELRGKLLGLTDVTNNMGSVVIEPGAPKDQFNYELNTDLGNVSIGGNSTSGTSASSSGQAKNMLKVKADMGEIRVNFD